MSTTPPGWFPDPYRRAQQRYWDGQRWSDWVSTNGQTSHDPIVAASAPIAASAASTASPTPSPYATPVEPRPMAAASKPFGETLGPGAKQRPEPSLRGALGAVGGAALALGLSLLIVGDSASRGAGIAVGIVLIALAVVVMLKAPLASRDIRAAAVAMVAVGIVVFVFAAFGKVNEGTYLIAGVVYLVGWIVPPFRGTPLLLGLGTLLVVFGIGAAIGSSQAFGTDDGFGSFGDDFGRAHGAGIWFLFATVALAVAVYLLDRAGFRGVSTPLLVTALASSLFGAFFVGIGSESEGIYLVVAIAGAVLAYVGSHGAHRATTWFGAAMLGVGAVSFAVAIFSANSVHTAGIVVLVIGVVLIGAPRVLRRIRFSDESDARR